MSVYKLMISSDYIGKYYHDLRPATVDLSIYCTDCRQTSVTEADLTQYLTPDGDEDLTLNKYCKCGLGFEMGVKKVDGASTTALIGITNGFNIAFGYLSDSSVKWSAKDPKYKSFFFKTVNGEYTVDLQQSEETTKTGASQYDKDNISNTQTRKRQSEMASGSGSGNKARHMEFIAPVEQVPDESESETEVDQEDENPSDENANPNNPLEENANLSDESANPSDESANPSDKKDENYSEMSDDYNEECNKSENEGVDEMQAKADKEAGEATYEIRYDNIDYEDEDEVSGAMYKGLDLRVRGLKIWVGKVASPK